MRVSSLTPSTSSLLTQGLIPRCPAIRRYLTESHTPACGWVPAFAGTTMKVESPKQTPWTLILRRHSRNLRRAAPACSSAARCSADIGGAGPRRHWRRGDQGGNLVPGELAISGAATAASLPRRCRPPVEPARKILRMDGTGRGGQHADVGAPAAVPIATVRAPRRWDRSSFRQPARRPLPSRRWMNQAAWALRALPFI